MSHTKSRLLLPLLLVLTLVLSACAAPSTTTGDTAAQSTAPAATDDSSQNTPVPAAEATTATTDTTSATNTPAPVAADATATQPPHSDDDHDDHDDDEPHDGYDDDYDHDALLTIPDLSGITLPAGERLRVVATTSIIGDVVRNIAGDSVDLTVLMAQGQDPHSYQPTASDLTVASNAHIVFINGWDLEEGLINDLTGAVEGGVIVPISAGVVPLEGEDDDDHAEHDAPSEDDDHHHAHDPHVWFDTANVVIWTDNVVQVLTTLDSANAATYQSNGDAYKAELATLDQYIRDNVAQISPANRKLVTNHDTFSYFANAYGFDVEGTILDSVSTGTEPSASDMNDLIEDIREENVKAVFIENVVGEGLANVLVEETGVQIYQLYTDALDVAGSGADTYISMVRTNVDTLVTALGN